MKCTRCSFESPSARLVEIHYEATHEQEMILEIAGAVKGREKGAKKDGQ